MTTLLGTSATAKTGEIELATFYLGDALLGIPIDQVDEINHHLDLTDVPHVPACVRGVINLRGEVVTVIDLRVVLGLPPAELARRTCNVVVRWRGERVGLVVDAVGDVIRARRADIEPPPANVAGSDARFFTGVCKLDQALLAILDVEQTLALEAAA